MKSNNLQKWHEIGCYEFEIIKMTKEKNLKFFIVFKDAFSRMLYQQYLHNLGYKNFVLMESCEDCFDKMDLEPDIIFLDFDLYPNDGLEMVKKMKLLNPNVHIQIGRAHV